MAQEKAQELGRFLRGRREELGLSTRKLAAMARVDDSTIVRFEQGAYAAPSPEKLSRIAQALNLSLADVYALVDYAIPSDLPTFRLYLRTKYRDLPAPVLDRLHASWRKSWPSMA